MKEIQLHKQDEVKIEASVQQEKQEKYIGSIKPHQGHTCFELDTKSMEIKIASFKEEAIDFESAKEGFKSKKKKLIIKEHHLYVTALNAKNAAKKFAQMLTK